MVLQRKRGLASSLSYWTTLILAAASLLMVVLGVAVNYRNQAIGQAIEQQFHEQARVQELDRLSREAISSYRGYMAYGRQEFLDELYPAVESLLVELDRMSREMALGGQGDKRKSDEAAYIHSMWRELSSTMEKGIQFKQANDTQAMDILSKTRSVPASESISKRFGDLLALQESHVQELVQENKEISFRLLLVPVVMILFIGLTGYYLVYYLRKSVITPVLDMSSAVRQIAAGTYVEVKPSERTDELGDLQRGILQMSEDLKRRESELETYNRELITQRDLLEVQNEEIIAQQEEQQETLQKLTAREGELELISSYQEKLAGYLNLKEFMEKTVPALLLVVGADGAAIILKRGEGTRFGGELVYSSGYPEGYLTGGAVDLFGPAAQVFTEKRMVARVRELSGPERGVYGIYERALDHYVPLMDNDQEVYGFLLLTSYGGPGLNAQSVRYNKGLVTQFSLALLAQVMNEERVKQAELLEHLNAELTAEKQRLQEQRDLIRQINESIHEGMLMLDADGRVLFANQRLESFFGYAVADGHVLDDFIECLTRTGGPGVSSTLSMKVKGMLDGAADRFHDRFVFEGPDGGRHFELYVNAVEGPELAAGGFLLVFRDRTDEEKVDEMKNEFISIVSHELRTPLSSVLGFIEILLNRTVPPDKQKRYLETIYNEANRLSNLINDFLDLQRMEAGKQIYQPVPEDMPQLLRQVMEQWQGKNGHAIRLEAEEEGLVATADRDRFTQVLHNLISNAVKYSPGSDRVDIRCVRDGEWIRIDVQDYGLGIPEDAKDKLFSKFYRVDNSDRRQIGGTGLGLSIVKEIVEALGGHLSFESELGRGSVFRVYLPAYREKDLSGKVVIVEDDDNLAKMVAVSFEKMNVPTVILDSSEDAVLSMNRSAGSPLLCIVDIQLKGVQSGWDFISEMLKHPVHRDTPVIVSTVLEQPNHFYETPKEKFLKKPFTIGRMLELAQLLISERQTAAASFVFPFQDARILSDSLEHNGITVKGIKVQSDFIEVDVETDGRENT